MERINNTKNDEKMEIPNAETRAAMAEAEEILLNRRKRLGIVQG